MAKIYTAQEMREEAMSLDELEIITAPSMLRQAADALEREEKREKKYEFAPRYIARNGSVSYGCHYSSIREALLSARPYKCERFTIVRREVSEWEEANNG